METNNTLSSSSLDSLSISDLDSSFSSSSPSPSSTLNFPKCPSYPKMAGPRFFLSSDADGTHHHFLDSCHLCKKPIGGGRDIFMYRGDTPFCSEECRQEQIEIDEDDERRVSRSKKKEQKSMAPLKNEKIDLRVAGTVVAV